MRVVFARRSEGGAGNDTIVIREHRLSAQHSKVLSGLIKRQEQKRTIIRNELLSWGRKTLGVAHCAADPNLVDKTIKNLIIAIATVVTANRNILITQLRRTTAHRFFARHHTVNI